MYKFTFNKQTVSATPAGDALYEVILLPVNAQQTITSNAFFQLPRPRAQCSLLFCSKFTPVLENTNRQPPIKSYLFKFRLTEEERDRAEEYRHFAPVAIR